MRASRIRSIAAAAAIAAGTIGIAAPAAHAMPASDRAVSECSAVNGHFTNEYYYDADAGHWVRGGAHCEFTGYDGKIWTDYYDHAYEWEATCRGRFGHTNDYCERA